MNVRPSNTEPLLRLNLEALDQELMERKRDEVLAVIRGTDGAHHAHGGRRSTASPRARRRTA